MDLSLVHCLDLLRSNNADAIDVITAYQTASEAEQSNYGSIFAPAGSAIVLTRTAAIGGPSTTLRFAVDILHTCGAVVSSGGSLIGLKLYRDAVGVYRVMKSVNATFELNSPISDWQETPLAFARAAEDASLNSSEFDRYLRQGRPLKKSCSARLANLLAKQDAPPAGLDPSYVYPKDISRSRRRRDLDPIFDFCESSKTARSSLASSSWQQVLQLASSGQRVSSAVKDGLVSTKEKFEQCLTFCNGVSASLNRDANPEAAQSDAVCSEAIRRMPYRFGDEAELSDSCHFYRVSASDNNYRSSRMHDNACQLGLCLEETPIFSFWKRILETTFTPTIEGVAMDPEPLWSDDQPTPVFKILQETFSMECSGAVVVWVMDSQDIVRMENVLRGLFVYNPAVMRVDIRCDATEKLAVQDLIADLIEGWQSMECQSPRLLMPFYTVASMEEYDGTSD
jgi:hypothetical protein